MQFIDVMLTIKAIVGGHRHKHVTEKTMVVDSIPTPHSGEWIIIY